MTVAELIAVLFPHFVRLHVDFVRVTGRTVRLQVRGREPSADCSGCGASSARVHSRYERRISDNNERVVDFVTGNAPTSPSTWTAQALRGRITAYVMCAPGNAGITTSSGWSAPGYPAIAVCPSETALTTGGYAARPRTNAAGENIDALVADSPADQPGNAWGAGLKLGSTVAYAVCSW